MPERVLVTGACGLVGSATVARLRKAGIPVVATDLDTAANRRIATRFGDASTRWCDLTQRSQVQTLLAAVRPAAIIHLAAVIPPFCYKQPASAHRVNVEATALLISEASGLTAPPRFVQASSVSVYGPRNPHMESEILTSDTRLAPFDVYGAQKVAAEGVVRQSHLDWVILRLGGVIAHRKTVAIQQLAPTHALEQSPKENAPRPADDSRLTPHLRQPGPEIRCRPSLRAKDHGPLDPDRHRQHL